jgi:hypothetical protein
VTQRCLIILVACLALLPAGCSKDILAKPEYHIDSCLGSPAELGRIDRVTFINLQLDERRTAVAEDFNLALVKAIQDREFMNIDSLDRGEELSLQLPADGKPLSLDQLSRVRKLTGSDAIICGTITRFQSYPRMQVGLRLQLLDLKKGRVLWVVDHVWDTTSQAVERRIEEFFKTDLRSGYEPMQYQLAMVSPKVFARFVAREVAATLPGRPAPCPPGGSAGL